MQYHRYSNKSISNIAADLRPMYCIESNAKSAYSKRVKFKTLYYSGIGEQ